MRGIAVFSERVSVWLCVCQQGRVEVPHLRAIIVTIVKRSHRVRGSGFCNCEAGTMGTRVAVEAVFHAPFLVVRKVPTFELWSLGLNATQRRWTKPEALHSLERELDAQQLFSSSSACFTNFQAPFSGICYFLLLHSSRAVLRVKKKTANSILLCGKSSSAGEEAHTHTLRSAEKPTIH